MGISDIVKKDRFYEELNVAQERFLKTTSESTVALGIACITEKVYIGLEKGHHFMGIYFRFYIVFMSLMFAGRRPLLFNTGVLGLRFSYLAAGRKLFATA